MRSYYLIVLVALMITMVIGSQVMNLRRPYGKREPHLTVSDCSNNPCSNGETCCDTSQGPGCCPASNACCCADQQHCCPSGFKCVCQGGSCPNCMASDRCSSEMF